MHHARFFSGQYFLGRGRSFTVGSVTPAADYLYAIPFDQQMIIDAVALHNKGGGTDAVCRLGIYSNDDNLGVPETLLYGSDEIDLGDSETGIKTFELAEAFDSWAAPFWVAALFGGTPPAISSCAVSASVLDIQQAFGNYAINASAPPRYGMQVAQSYGALPSTFPSGAGASISTMALCVRGA